MTDMPPPSPPDGLALCDRCQTEFVFWMPQRTDGFDDVFHKIQQSMGKVVCPECIRKFSPRPPAPNGDQQ